MLFQSQTAGQHDRRADASAADAALLCRADQAFKEWNWRRTVLQHGPQMRRSTEAFGNWPIPWKAKVTHRHAAHGGAGAIL